MGQRPRSSKIVLLSLSVLFISTAGCSSIPPADGLFLNAQTAFSKSDFTTTIRYLKTFEKYYPKDPRYPDALLIIAESYYASDRHKDSYLYYEKFLDFSTDNEKRRSAVTRLFNIATEFAEGRKEPSPIFLSLISFPSRNFGAEELRKLCARYSCYPEAQRAMLTVAKYYLDSADYEEAQLWLDKVILEKPDEETVSTAIYLKAEALYRTFKGTDYDIETVIRALKFFTEYLRRAPTGAFRKDALARVSQIEQTLAERELRIARFYLKDDNYESAKVHLHYLLKTYPHTVAAKEAQTLLDGLKK